jgi:hypothetical protein
MRFSPVTTLRTLCNAFFECFSSRQFQHIKDVWYYFVYSVQIKFVLFHCISHASFIVVTFELEY